MDILLVAICSFLAFIISMLVWAIISFNNLRALEARCKQASNDIDVQLKQRSDLLPNLVGTVRSFVGQETQLLNMLQEIQSEMNNAASIHNNTKNNANISNQFSNVFASLDQIPELQSSSHYISLRNQLVDTENKIEASRRFLNLATSEFNTKRNQLPGSVISSFAKINEQKGYSLGEERTFYDEAPIVKL